MVNSVGCGSVDDGNGLGKELFRKRDVACFDGGIVLLDRVLHAGFLCDVFRIPFLGNQDSLFCGLDVGQYFLLLRYNFILIALIY